MSFLFAPLYAAFVEPIVLLAGISIMIGIATVTLPLLNALGFIGDLFRALFRCRTRRDCAMVAFAIGLSGITIATLACIFNKLYQEQPISTPSTIAMSVATWLVFALIATILPRMALHMILGGFIRERYQVERSPFSSVQFHTH